jgi:hypothetical protein
MGAGNPLIYSFDRELYCPTTFFIDFTPTRDFIIESFNCDEEDVPDENSDTWYERVNTLCEESYELFLEQLTEDSEYGLYRSKKDSFDELSAAYRGSATVLAEGENLLLVTAGEDYHHMSIGCVPNFKFDDFYQDCHYENGDKELWYDARKLNYDEALQKQANKKYDKYLKLFRKEAIKVMSRIHKFYGKQMSVRNGPWTSLSIKTIGKDYFKNNL